MIRITVSYPNAEGRRFDHAYYQATHRQLLLGRSQARIPQCAARRVDQ